MFSSLNLRDIYKWLIIMLIGIIFISVGGIIGIANDLQLNSILKMIIITGFILLIGGFFGSIIFADKNEQV